ncbi:hypothetical protein ACN47E_003214 [Coniothyrium glycines]
MDPRKRPPPPRSRGHSPPDKRPRPLGRPASTNPKPDANARSAPASPSMSTHPAPQAPSMLPTATSDKTVRGHSLPANTLRLQENAVKGNSLLTSAALQRLKHRKREIALRANNPIDGSLPHNTATANDNTAAANDNMAAANDTTTAANGTISDLQAEIKSLKAQRKEFEDKFARIEEQQRTSAREASEAIGQMRIALKDEHHSRIGSLEQEKLLKLIEQIRSTQSQPSEYAAQIERLQVEQGQIFKKQTVLGERLSQLEKHVSDAKASLQDLHNLQGDPSVKPANDRDEQLEDIWTNIHSMTEGLADVERKTKSNTSNIAVLEKSIPDLFRRKFDGLQREFEALNQRITTQIEPDITSLKGVLSAAQVAQIDAFCVDIKALKGHCTQLRTSLDAEVSARVHDIRILAGKLSVKADVDDVRNQMDAFKMSLNSLNDQYNNISTDEIYLKMVHWFVKTYPTAQMLLQISALTEKMNSLGAFNTELSWIQSNRKDLTSQQQLPDLRTKMDRGVQDATLALRRIQSVESTSEQQGSVIDAIQSTVEGLQSALKKMQVTSRQAGTSTSDNTENPDSVTTQIQQVSQEIATLQAQLDSVDAEYIKPNQTFLQYLGVLYAVVAQMQQIIDAILFQQGSSSSSVRWVLDLNKSSSLSKVFNEQAAMGVVNNSTSKEKGTSR